MTGSVLFHIFYTKLNIVSLFLKKIYKIVPKNAEIISGVVKGKKKRIAKWKNKKGKTFTGEVVSTPNGDRVVTKSSVYVARFRDKNGKVVEKSTRSRDKTTAQTVLQDWLKEIEKIKAGILTSDELEIGKKSQDSIEVVLKRYGAYLQSKGAKEKHIGEVKMRIETVCADCKFRIISDINGDAVTNWMNAEAKNRKRGATTRNRYREAIHSFCRWAKRIDRSITRNPIEDVEKAQESTDQRRKRRALSVEQIEKLFDVAKGRPLREALMIRKGKRKGELAANIREEVKRRLELLGLERVTMYSTMIYTGLRKNELKSLTIGQVVFNHKPPFLLLHPKDAKNKQEAGLPIHPCLVGMLKEWLKHKEAVSGPDSIKPDKPLFRVPDKLVKILDRDLALAGIEKCNCFGQLDVHALRHTHATQLAKAGVSPALAQKSMRHSDIRLTMGVYTHLEMEDTASAINELPNFGENNNEKQ